MPPQKHPRVDYLRVYPGLNDFSDALEAIPQTVVGHITNLKEVDAKFPAVLQNVGNEIKAYFRDRDPEKLRKIGQNLDSLLPAVGQKMHIASLAAEQVAHQLDRLNTDYKMICEHEVPQSVQVDNHDPAFIEIVPPEKQASAKSQARREAREAREARRIQQQQESRASTPVSVEPAVNLTSRRRGRTATPQAPVATPPAVNGSHQPVTTSHLRNGAANVRSELQEQKFEPRAHVDPHRESHREEDHATAVGVPPVVMPLPPMAKTEEPEGQEDGGAEIMVGLKRKRGAAPKSSEPVYCYCQQGSFGEMVGCDGPNCEREWFHLGCIGLSALPKGQWFCEECRAKLRRR